MSTTTSRAKGSTAPRLLVYLRRSLDDKQAESIETQRAVCQRFAEAHDLPWGARVEYVDDGISGADFKRAGLVGLVGTAASGDTILTVDDSRLGRDSLEPARILRVLIRERGARLFYTSSGRQASATTGLDDVQNVLAGFASQTEREKIVQRTKDALRERAAAGFVAGTIPYGFAAVPISDEEGAKKRLAHVAAEVETARRIVRMFLDGAGASTIARRLNAEGTPSPSGRAGKCWTPPTVRRLLRAPSLRGVFTFGGTTTTRPDLAILDEATADALADRLAAREADASATRTVDHATHVLSGVARCSCGAALIFVGVSSKKRPGMKAYGYYRCANGRVIGKRCTAVERVSWRAADLEASVLRYATGDFFNEAAATIKAEIRAEVERVRSSAAPDVAGLQAALDAAKARRKRYVKLAGDTDDEEIHSAAKEAAAEVRALEQQIAAASRPAIDDVTARRIEEAALAGLAKLRERLSATSDPASVREALAAVYPGGLTIGPDGMATGAAVLPTETDPTGKGPP